MKVAIVHDWFVSGGGGAEQVAYELHRMFPEAPIYTSYCSRQWREQLGSGKVVTGFLQHWPFSKLRKFLPPLRIWWFSHLNFDGFDLVISSSGAEAKGIKVNKPTIHINYCHAPTHYYWNRYEQYLKSPGFGLFDPLARLGLKLLVGPLRKWDFKAAQQPDYIIANSTYTKEQIKKYYERETVVIHPPVDIERFKDFNKPGQQRHGFVTAGRQTPYKKFDLAVEAATKAEVPLLVIGNGPQHSYLERLGNRKVTFLTQASDEELASHFGASRAFIFPGVDDFGIVAIEAMAAGTPVIAFHDGGALDYIIPAKTGEFFDKQTVEALAETMQKFKLENFNHEAIAKVATRFSASNFREAMGRFINSKVKK